MKNIYAYTGKTPASSYVGYISVNERENGIEVAVRSEGEQAPVGGITLTPEQCEHLANALLAHIAGETQPAVQTMNDKYGDGSDHIACNGCGLCVSCGDCARYGCRTGEAQPAEQAKGQETAVCAECGGDGYVLGSQSKFACPECSPTPPVQPTEQKLIAVGSIRVFMDGIAHHPPFKVAITSVNKTTDALPVGEYTIYTSASGNSAECRHGVDDGSCKECYAEQVNGKEAVAFFRADYPTSGVALGAEIAKAKEDQRIFGVGFTIN